MTTSSCSRKVRGYSDVQATSVAADATSQTMPEIMLKVRALLEGVKRTDAFNNCFFDFSEMPTFTDKQELKTVKFLLPDMLKELEGKHVIGLKLLPSQARIVKYAMQLGFTFHDANSKDMLLTLCLKGHEVANCNYPKFMTVSIGVTGVVFDEQLKNVLLIQEKWGGLDKMKPPTGTVDYLEINEDPLTAVVRELKEETNIDVDPSKAVLVGNTWTQKLRENNPDVNFIFAFRLRTGTKAISLQAQEDEISSVGWLDVKNYIAPSSVETNQPWGSVVRAAFQAFNHQKEWTRQNLCWKNGKPVQLFCFNPN